MHGFEVERIAQSSVMIRREAVLIASAEHKYCAQREVVLSCSVKSQSRASEEVVSPAAVFRHIVLVGIVPFVNLLTLGAAFIVAMAIPDVEIRIDERTIIIDVERCIGSSSRICSCL